MRHFWSFRSGDYRAGHVRQVAILDLSGRGTGALSETLRTLVLVANDHCAIFCANCNGVTHLIRRIGCPCRTGVESEYIGRDRRIGRRFARDLIATVEHDVEDDDYDGVIVLADASIYGELCRTPIRNIPNLLITPLPDASSDLPACLPAEARFERDRIQ